ncbi:unnamed protein product [Eruca vesicaria subsp. sativa]|uniref:Uncharacterized protein n=1 Tax=Eruca vesicaria subsp. sativa TaxID=29727 RepID=A0ABC8JJZ4_ERUVS|nr:unnamed protein product [Eruca vesicaria subsp. sativa]
MGISLDISTIVDNMDIREGAFKSMRNLRFLSIYKARYDANVRVHVPEDMDFPPRLRLLRWEVYPRKCLPRTFCPEYLVELDFRRNLLEKLWEGTQVGIYICVYISMKILATLAIKHEKFKIKFI